MAGFSRLRSLWRNLVHKSRVERELDDEVRAAFDLFEDEQRQAGMSPEAARRAAMLQLGRHETIKDQIRDVKAGAFLATCFQDVRYAVRLLGRSPVFAAFAIASLSLGHRRHRRDLFALRRHRACGRSPCRSQDVSWSRRFGGPDGRVNYSLPYPQFEAIRDRATSFEGVFAVSPAGRVTVTAAGDAQLANRAYVTGDYYQTLRLSPALGRLLTRDDDRPGQATAVLNYGYWQQRFGGRPDIVGTTVLLNQVPFTIVGVEPQGFSGTEVGRPYDVSLPMRSLDLFNEGKPLWNEAFSTWIYIMGRLKPGVTMSAAERRSSDRSSRRSASTPRVPSRRCGSRASTGCGWNRARAAAAAICVTATSAGWASC